MEWVRALLLTRWRDVCRRPSTVRSLTRCAVTLRMGTAGTRNGYSRWDPAGGRVRRWARLLLVVRVGGLHGAEHLRYLIVIDRVRRRGAINQADKEPLKENYHTCSGSA